MAPSRRSSSNSAVPPTTTRSIQWLLSSSDAARVATYLRKPMRPLTRALTPRWKRGERAIQTSIEAYIPCAHRSSMTLRFRPRAWTFLTQSPRWTVLPSGTQLPLTLKVANELSRALWKIVRKENQDSEFFSEDNSLRKVFNQPEKHTIWLTQSDGFITHMNQLYTCKNH